MIYTKVFLDAIAYELGPVVVSSLEIEERLLPLYNELGIAPGQLAAMTGIRERRQWELGYPLYRGAAEAALKVLEGSRIPSRAIESLIYGGVCRQHFEPAMACHVASELQRRDYPINPDAQVYDISNACLGMVNGIITIADRIELGQIRAGMVVSCESSREILDEMVARMLQRRGIEQFSSALATLTGGSAAAAILLSDGSFPAIGRHRVLGAVSRTDPSKHLLCSWGYEPTEDGLLPGARPAYRQRMTTDAVGVLEGGRALGSETFPYFLRELGWKKEDIDRVVSHQVGSAHRKALLEGLEIPAERDFAAYEYLGNTGTVALPLAAALAEEHDFLNPGQRVLFVGFGSGLNCVMMGLAW